MAILKNICWHFLDHTKACPANSNSVAPVGEQRSSTCCLQHTAFSGWLRVYLFKRLTVTGGSYEVSKTRSRAKTETTSHLCSILVSHGEHPNHHCRQPTKSIMIALGSNSASLMNDPNNPDQTCSYVLNATWRPRLCRMLMNRTGPKATPSSSFGHFCGKQHVVLI